MKPDEPAFEPRDADPKPLLQLGIGLAILIAVSLLVSDWLDHAFTEEAPPPPMARNTPEASPPDATWPVLQANPGTELAEYRQEMEQRLGQYGWVDRENGIARIPIDRALEIYLERANAEAAPPAGGRR